MSTPEGQGPEQPAARTPQDPLPEGADAQIEEQQPPEEEAEYVIEDLDAMDSPTGGAAVSCTCGCFSTGTPTKR